MVVAVSVLAVVALVGDDARERRPAVTSQENVSHSGGARLAVDQATVDRGAVGYGEPVEAVYRLRNDGDQPLRLGKPTINVLAGC